MDKDNPARDLLIVIQQLKDLPPSTKIRDAITTVMDLPGKTDRDISDGVLKLVQLAVRTESMVRELSNVDPPLMLETMPRFYKTFFRINFDDQIETIRSGFDDLALYGLRLCADSIDRFGTEIQLDLEKLNELYGEIVTLIAEVVDSEIDSQLQRVVLEHLTKIQNAILNYKIGGTEGLRRAAESSFTMFFSQADEIIKQDKPGTLKKVGRFVLRILDVTNVAIKVDQLTGGGLAGLLGSG